MKQVFKTLFLLFLSTGLFAQNGPDYPYCKHYIELKHVGGQGPGIDRGYTMGKYMVYPRKYESHVFPFFDLRFLMSNHGRPAASAGVGVRFQPRDLAFTGGVNLYYDFRDYRDRFYNQFGLGLEILQFLGFDLTINGYLPITNSKTVLSCLFDSYSDGYFIKKKRSHIPQSGISFILGKATELSPHVASYVAAEGYYYGGPACSDRTYFGKKLKVALLFRVLKGEGSISHDPIFGTNIQGTIGILFPFGCKSKKRKLEIEPFVQRNDTVFMRKSCRWRTNF